MPLDRQQPCGGHERSMVLVGGMKPGMQPQARRWIKYELTGYQDCQNDWRMAQPETPEPRILPRTAVSPPVRLEKGGAHSYPLEVEMDEQDNTQFWKGLLIAIPISLLMWWGILKLAGVL
jgi:hypothetical protein